MMHAGLPTVACSGVYLHCGPVDMRKSFDGSIAAKHAPCRTWTSGVSMIPSKMRSDARVISKELASE